MILRVHRIQAMVDGFSKYEQQPLNQPNAHPQYVVALTGA
jgi:hypothetical protein